MFRAFVVSLWMSYTSFALVSFAKPLDSTEMSEAIEDLEIEEIANREYDTVHGRILAVNEAHIREQAAQAEGSGNVFAEIEKANTANLSNLYQGDIIRDAFLENFLSGGKSRNGVRNRAYLWGSRRIPYYVPGRMSHITANLMKAFAEIERTTCLRFVPYNGRVHKNYITFSNTDGCSSKVGRKHWPLSGQTISLGTGCNKVGIILHELLHAIGFWHEQARWDRDKYVKIYWQNIIYDKQGQFRKLGWRDSDDLGISYDYNSIMHYGRTAFTKNRLPTIVAIGNENMELGARDRKLSPRDILKINALYDCSTKQHGWTQWSNWTPCDEECYMERERYCYHNGNIKFCKTANRYGVVKERLKCPKSICPAPIDGNWGRWSEWRACDASCDDGKQTRVRRCNNPAPAHEGRACAGKGSEWKICTKRRCRLDADDTDFENFRLGMWSQSTDDKLSWVFNKGPTQTINTGPVTDHTIGNWNGYYLYVESSGVQAGSDAKLVTRWVTPTRNVRKCLKLYYLMRGQNMGELWVMVQVKGTYNTKYGIFFKKGEQGKEWKYGSGNIDIDVGMSYRLIIDARVGNGYSDIAIDDVYVDDGLCRCQDKYVSCGGKFRQEFGCQTPWMRTNCPRTCNKCNGDGGWGEWSSWTSCNATCAGTKTRARNCDSPVPSKGGRACAGQKSESRGCHTAANCPAGSCQDNDDRCAKWATEGECDKNPVWMWKNCKASCHKCPTIGPPCRDNDDRCAKWAMEGECDKNPVWMWKNCKESCHKCPTPSPPCQDNDDRCDMWAKVGECQKNPGWMLVNCKKSCNDCPTPSSPLCVDGHSSCPIWAHFKECEKKPRWMLKTCKKSCKQC